jgi:hypothetical protein
LESPGYGGGALEAYSYATYGGGFPEEDAHEPAHTWWGGILNNTYLGSFWNESFAVFSDGLYHRNAPIGSIEDRRLAFVSQGDPQRDYNDRAIEGSGAFAGPVGSSLGYGKGAKVLAMLEQLIGTEKMIATMKEWVSTDHGKAVDWPDFERVAIRMNPERKLKSFFDDWLRKPGYADLLVDNVAYADGKVTFRVGFAGDSYRIPLEVMTITDGNSRHFSTVDVTAPGTYSVAATEKPSIVSFDPWLRVLRTIDASERTDNLARSLFRGNRYVDPAHTDYFGAVGGQAIKELPRSLDNLLIVGHPSTTPQMKELCEKVGFEVDGNKLTYRGTSIDLEHGGAAALVPLPGGGKCMIALGKMRVSPSFGIAKIAVFDGYGRMLRSESEPKTSGKLTVRL